MPETMRYRRVRPTMERPARLIVAIVAIVREVCQDGIDRVGGRPCRCPGPGRRPPVSPGWPASVLAWRCWPVATPTMIPTMIKVDGGDASAASATGQAVGAVGAVLIAYGWIVSGPAAVARADAVGSPDGVSGVAADASGDLCSRRRLRPGCRAGRADRPGSGRARVGLDRDDRFDRQLVLRGHRSARRPDGADRRAAPGPVHPVVAILGTNGEIAAPAPAGNELRDSGPAARPAASPISTASGSTERTPTPNGSGSRTATPWSKTPDLTGRHGRQGCQ